MLFFTSRFLPYPLQRVHIFLHGATNASDARKSSIYLSLPRRCVSAKLAKIALTNSHINPGGVISSFSSLIYAKLAGKRDYTSLGASGEQLWSISYYK